MTKENPNRDIIQDPKPLNFSAVLADRQATWRRIDSFDFIDRLGGIAIADTELLQLSHHIPIAIDRNDDRLQVIAILATPFQRLPLVGKQGQWMRSYMPIALRCLPFRKAGDNLEIAVDLEGGQDELSMTAADGNFSPELRSISQLLGRLEAGKRRLQVAAETLLIADVLVPLQLAKLPDQTSASSRAYTVDPNRYATLSKQRTAHIARDDLLAIDLAAACIFSQRLMPGPISVQASAGSSAIPIERREPLLEFGSNTQLDSSELFSFENFNAAKFE